MTKHIDMSRLCFSDPRKGRTREFRAENGELLSNVCRNVVVIECDSYGVYANPSQVAHLIIAAFTSCPPGQLLLRVQPKPAKLQKAFRLPNTWRTIQASQFQLLCVIPVPRFEELQDVFEQIGHCEQWCFGLPAEDFEQISQAETSGLLDFDIAFRNSHKWHFVITVSLDDMLLGFMTASDAFDRFYLRLT